LHETMVLMNHPHIRRSLRLFLIGTALASVAASSACAQPAPFNAYLLPAASAVAVGDTVAVRFEVDATATEFNAYRISIRYRSDVVDFLPPVIEGALMIGACGATFQFLAEPDDSTLSYQHSILCGGAPLSGPGVLSIYRFVALADGTSPLEIVTDPDAMFADAGVWVNPSHPTFPRQVVLHNAAIQIGVTGVPETPTPHLLAPLALASAPNPFRSSTELTLSLGCAAPIVLQVFDVAGRHIWTHEATLAAGRHAIAFPRSAAGYGPLPNGTYICLLRTPYGAASEKLTLVR